MITASEARALAAAEYPILLTIESAIQRAAIKGEDSIYMNRNTRIPLVILDLIRDHGYFVRQTLPNSWAGSHYYIYDISWKRGSHAI